MAKQREEDAVFVGFESNLPTARVERSRDDQSLGPPPVDPDLIAAALAEAEAEEAKAQQAPPAEAGDEEDLDDEESKAKPWLKWVIIAVVVAVIGYFAYSQMKSDPAPADAASPATQPAEGGQDDGPESSPTEETTPSDTEEAP